ncbi:hypothetical protein ACA910_020161 [Epithemia clementina (nom. ined.)]
MTPGNHPEAAYNADATLQPPTATSTSPPERSTSIFSFFLFPEKPAPQRAPTTASEQEGVGTVGGDGSNKNHKPDAEGNPAGEIVLDPHNESSDHIVIEDLPPNPSNDGVDVDEEGSHSASSLFFDQLFLRRASVDIPVAHSATAIDLKKVGSATLPRDEVQRLLSDPAVLVPGTIVEHDNEHDNSNNNYNIEDAGGGENGKRFGTLLPATSNTSQNSSLADSKNGVGGDGTPEFTRHARNAGKWTIVAFVNSRSGGQKGVQVHADLIKLLGKEYVFDLSKVKKGNMPEDKLMPYAKDPQVRVLGCGGDGTMGWIESAIDTVWKRILGEGVSVENSPYKGHLPLAIMPLGTGNDLSRTFGWGKQYSKVMGRPEMIRRVEAAKPQCLDRWRCVVIPDNKLDEETRNWVPDMLGYKMVDPARESIFLRGGDTLEGGKEGFSIDKSLRRLVGQSTSTSSNNNTSANNVNIVKKTEEQPSPAEETTDMNNNKTTTVMAGDSGSSEVVDGIFCNYMSIGVDAQIAFSFHKDRSEHPEKYTSVAGNKVKYVTQGLANGVGAQPLHGKLKLWASTPTRNDTGLTTMSEIPIPKSCRAVVLLNIPSYGGGNRLINHGAKDDGLIDVVFVTTIWRLVLIGGFADLLPFTRFRKAAQADRVCIKTHEPLHCQVDGEPWLQGAATIKVRFFGQSTVLQRDRSCLFNCATDDATVSSL